MTRKDKLKTDPALINEIIHSAQFCHLACSLDDQPYLVPVSFGYDGQAVFIHTARTGKKISVFEANPRVCLSFVARADLVTDPDQACDFSFEYACVIAEGSIHEITDPKEKKAGLDQVMGHYSDGDWSYPDKSLARTRVWKVSLHEPTVKISPQKD